MYFDNLNSDLVAKASDIKTFSIESPTGRTSKKTKKVLKTICYFDAAKYDKKAEVWKPTAKSRIVTALEVDANEIEHCEVGKVTTLSDRDDDDKLVVMRWFDSDLTDEELESIKSAKANKKANSIIEDTIKLVADLSNPIILNKLTDDKRELLRDEIAKRMMPALERLTSAPAAATKKAKIRLFN